MQIESLIEANLELVRYLSLNQSVVIGVYKSHYLISKSFGRCSESQPWWQVQIDLEHL
jgi:hypothetical protein